MSVEQTHKFLSKVIGLAEDLVRKNFSPEAITGAMIRVEQFYQVEGDQELKIIQVVLKIPTSGAHDLIEEKLLRQFLDERTFKDSLASAPAGDLYEAYCAWAVEQGLVKKLNQQQFGKALRTWCGFRAARGAKGLRLWKGLALRLSLIPSEEEQTREVKNE
jgi:hypothetical protein